nr:uncharacterized protein LOC109149917 [Ipomoea batatas]
MDVTVEPPPTTVPSAEGGSNRSVRSFKKVKVTKRNFAETVLALPRLGDDEMDNAEDVDCLKDEVIVDSDVEDDTENYPLGIAVFKIPNGLRKEIVKQWKKASLIFSFLAYPSLTFITYVELKRWMLCRTHSRIADIMFSLLPLVLNDYGILELGMLLIWKKGCLSFSMVGHKSEVIHGVVLGANGWKVRDGASLNMWTDWWVGSKPLGLEESFVILEELSSCKAAREIWRNMLSPSTFSFSQNWTVAEWIENNYCNMAHVDGVGSWATFFCFLLWGFWKPRNDVVFRRRKKEARLIVCKAREQTI